MQVETSIFKAYDIRGIYPEQINEQVEYAIARAYATILLENNGNKKLRLAVGGDMRVSTPSLKERVIRGLLDSGIDVEDIGLVSTPSFYFATAFFGYDGGLQVSASHNPKVWNGVKIVGKNASPVSRDSGIMEIKQRVESDDYIPLADQKGVLSKQENIVEAEASEQLKDFDMSAIRPLKIALDGSNGMGSDDLNALFERLPQCTTYKINFELDGTFPGHPPDPMIFENSADIRRLVVEKKCDLGIMPDGDADRYFFIDEKGEILPQQILRGIMAAVELKDSPGIKVAYDIRPGKITKDMIDELGGTSVVTPVGHSLIKEAMIREGAAFGAESSGHYYYKRSYGTFEMPMILVFKILKYLSEQNKPFSEIIRPFKKYFHSGEINIKMPDRAMIQKKLDEVKARYSDGKQNFLDGVSVEYNDYWFNLRASNTEPLIRLTVEARTQQLMEQKRDEILEFLNS